MCCNIKRHKIKNFIGFYFKNKLESPVEPQHEVTNALPIIVFSWDDLHYGTKKLCTAWFLLLKRDSCFISMICAKAWNLEVLKEISFSFSPLKQKRWLNRFVPPPFAKLLRYKMSDFHDLKYKNNSTWSQDPVHSAHTNLTWKKKTVSRIKDPKT